MFVTMQTRAYTFLRLFVQYTLMLNRSLRKISEDFGDESVLKRNTPIETSLLPETSSKSISSGSFYMRYKTTSKTVYQALLVD